MPCSGVWSTSAGTGPFTSPAQRRLDNDTCVSEKLPSAVFGALSLSVFEPLRVLLSIYSIHSACSLCACKSCSLSKATCFLSEAHPVLIIDYGQERQLAPRRFASWHLKATIKMGASFNNPPWSKLLKLHTLVPVKSSFNKARWCESQFYGSSV